MSEAIKVKAMLDRKNFDKYITETYGTTAEFPWASAPGFAVYRHDSNKKWFAVVMDIPKSKLGFEDEKNISVVNLKCDPLLIGSLVKDDGIFPAYHMNKSYWISVALDGSADDEKIKWLLNLSFGLTKKQLRKQKISKEKKAYLYRYALFILIRR